jgi:antibiotic biosynthesis monooxygenase (ABM) superfamily enzyme
MNPDAGKARAPSRLRFAAFVFLFVYPLVTAGLLILLPLTPGWPIPARTAVLVPIVVVSMVWGIIPFIQTRLTPWL